MPNIYDTLTIIGHRFGHQSGLDKSSGRNSTVCLHGIVSRIYLMFSQIAKTQVITEYEQKQTNKSKKACRFPNKTIQPVASLELCKWGLGIPIHIKMLFILE